MDVVGITVLATAIICALAPIDWYVAHRYYRAWRGGETIPYFAPTLAVIAAVAMTVTASAIVGLSSLQSRVTGVGFLPPGIGLLIVAFALILPSAALVWLWRLLRRRQQ